MYKLQNEGVNVIKQKFNSTKFRDTSTPAVSTMIKDSSSVLMENYAGKGDNNEDNISKLPNLDSKKRKFFCCF